MCFHIGTDYQILHFQIGTDIARYVFTSVPISLPMLTDIGTDANRYRHFVAAVSLEPISLAPALECILLSGHCGYY